MQTTNTTPNADLAYSVKTLRAAGLEARWGRTRNGAPMIFARNPASDLRHQRESWWAVGATMFGQMRAHGVREGFDAMTLLGDFFSIPA